MSAEVSEPRSTTTGDDGSYDETGEPVSRAWVQLSRYQYFDGRRRLVGNYGDSTDDRGEFRVFGIPPADCFLSATFSEAGDRSTDNVRYVQTF